MPTLAYVANANKVSVIDTSTNTVVNTIIATDPGYYAAIIAIAPNGKFAYVTNLYDSVSVIDTCSNTVIDKIKVGTIPVGIAITPNGRYAYVANSASYNVSVIDTSTNTVIDTIIVGKDPLWVAITPDGNFVYITIAQEDKISVIDTTSNTVVDTIPVGHFPHGIAITPDGRFAYVSNNEQPPLTTTVSVINTSTRTVVGTIPVGFVAATIAITPDGKFAYVANAGNDNVSVIDTATNTVIDTVPVGAYDYCLAITPDGSFVYVSNTLDGDVSVIDTNTNTVVDTIPIGNEPFGIAIANIPPCQTPSDKMCIETTRIFDSCSFEEQQEKVFKLPSLIEVQDIQCEVIETESSILDITRIYEQQDLVNVKLRIKVILGFIKDCSNNHIFKRVVYFNKSVALTAPEGADISCYINNTTCECIQTSDMPCNHKICCTVKVTGVVKSKKLVQIQVPFLGNCISKQCCSFEGIPVAPGKSLTLPSEPSRINRIKFAAKVSHGMTSQLAAFLNAMPYTSVTVTEQLKPFEINLLGGPFPVENISIKNLGNSTIYVYKLTTE